MKKFRFVKAYEYQIACVVEAETLEEAKEKAEHEEWFDDEGGEHWVTLDKWKCIDIPDDLDEEEDEEKIEELWEEADWEVEYDAYPDEG